jgi:hypothetical protein
MDYGDVNVAATIGVDAVPSYDVYSHRSSKSHGPQCALHRNFCFLCAFTSYKRIKPKEDDVEEEEEDEEDDDDDDEKRESDDLVTGMRDWIEQMAQSHATINNISHAVHDMYEKDIRPKLVWRHPKTKKKVKRPRWSLDSITTHLVHTDPNPALFVQITDMRLRSISHAQDKFMINPETGAVIEENRGPYMDTVSMWLKFQMQQHKIKNDRKRTRIACKVRLRTSKKL